MNLFPKSRATSRKLGKTHLNSKGMGGFTLIEMLIVVGIIGLLTILVVQALSDSKATSLDTQVRSNLKSLNQAHMRAYLMGDPFKPNATDPQWVDHPEDAVQWYIDNNYLRLPEFNPAILDKIELRPLTLQQVADQADPYIWQRR